MNYVLPNDLALKHNVSLKTIYNHLSKSHGKISLKRELWKTYVFESDFEKYYSKEVQNLQSDLQKPEGTEQAKGLWTLKEDFETLQKNYNIIFQ